MTLYFAIISSVILLAFLLSAVLWERSYVRAYRERLRENVYHCLKCGSIYTSRDKGESASCPVCGYRNGRLKF